MLGLVLHVVMAMGLVCNGVAICVILRQDARKPDLSLALVMVVSDLLLVIFNLGSSLIACFSNTSSGQWKAIPTIFLLQQSGVSVGFLALLRFWVIVMRRKVNLKMWWLWFTVGQVVVLSFVIAVACEDQFENLQLMSLYFPALNSGSWVVEACRHILLFSLIWPVVAVNVSYPCIAHLYESHLRFLESEELRPRLTLQMYFKILGFMLIYNFVMIPSLLVILLEEVTGELQSPILESISVVALFSSTFFNPLVLLTLHHETFCEFKNLLSQVKWKLKLST
ncbi:hypothetical protein DSO57_1017372 [Entomophthora muscae]|uniref:Uncharacterized protein n=1 Tax=Entomophthora muscae TaxID=34485 RepID=A0ACC2U2W3_9FUNG|nr:hypothetical protein DSO57_1017372 [Entomophthora muscae]